MRKNNTLREIGDKLLESSSLLIFPHIMMDGDAIGSAVALCLAMRDRGLESWVVIEDKLADNLQFLMKGCCVPLQECSITAPDISLCIDCGDHSRYPERAELYDSGRIKICIDHHPTSEGIADYNYIDPGAAATGEIVFDLLTECGVDINTEIAECLFAAIATDTGNYMYSNTTRRSHEITMALMDTGIDCSETGVKIYENEPIEKMSLQSRVLSGLELFADGQGVIAEVTQQMLQETGARMEDTEGIVSRLRSLKGVEIAVLVKEVGPGEYKVTMRAKMRGDVAAIAVRHDGGGHVKAAGCTLRGTLEEARAIIMQEVTAALEV
ncbi:MAG: DHH family phosphoesterase [Anaerovoracaceae bacterium]|jgi:phosphoesterase RecJ-like protein